jgi:hypothetical protein
LADFAKLNNNTSYPAKSYDGQESQSYNFTPAYKIQTGDSRGELTIKGLIRIVDANGVVLLVMGYKREFF